MRKRWFHCSSSTVSYTHLELEETEIETWWLDCTDLSAWAGSFGRYIDLRSEKFTGVVILYGIGKNIILLSLYFTGRYGDRGIFLYYWRGVKTKHRIVVSYFKNFPTVSDQFFIIPVFLGDFKYMHLRMMANFCQKRSLRFLKYAEDRNRSVQCRKAVSYTHLSLVCGRLHSFA